MLKLLLQTDVFHRGDNALGSETSREGVNTGVEPAESEVDPSIGTPAVGSSGVSANESF